MEADNIDPDQTAPLLGLYCLQYRLPISALRLAGVCSRRLQGAKFSAAFFIGVLGVKRRIVALTSHKIEYDQWPKAYKSCPTL